MPGDFVGLPNGTVTGREIFVYLNEPGQQGQTTVSIQSATLTAGGMQLPVKTVDQNTGTIGPYLTGGIIIPVNPLPQGTQIQASVTLNGPNGPVTHNWSFTTAQSPNASVTVNGTNITYATQSPAPALLRVFTPPDTGTYFILDDPLNPGTGPIPDIGNLPTGQQLVACVAQNPTNGYDAQTACSVPFTIPAPTQGGGGFGGAIHYLHLKAQLNGRHLSVTLPGLALGHTVRITMAYTGRVCRRGKCRTVSRGTRRLKRKATGTALSALVPTVAGANRVKVTVALLPFIKGGKTYQGKPFVVAGKV